MNIYLEKVAEMSNENKQVARTFAYQTAAGLPAHAAGAALGGYLGHKILEPRAAGLAAKLGRFGSKLAAPGNGRALGAAVGMGVAGGIADLAALKHSLHGKVKKE